MIWPGLAILLSCILIGARVGGIGLGAVSGLVFFAKPFGIPPKRRDRVGGLLHRELEVAAIR